MIAQSQTYRLRTAVLAHATTNYEQGWDVIVEAYEPAELDALIEEVGGDDAATVINRIADRLGTRAAYANDIRAAGDNPHREVERPVRYDATDQPAMATERQLSYLRDLATTREMPEDARAELLRRIDAGEVSKSRASDFITRLKDKPRRSGAPRSGSRFPVRFQTMELDGGREMELGFVDVNGSEVPQGKYALDTSADATHTNDIEFFNLFVARDRDTGEPFYSLKMYVSDDLVKMSADRQREVLGRIAADPGAASRLYGQHKVRCGVCNRKLTNDDSRALGIGPVCRERVNF